MDSTYFNMLRAKPKQEFKCSDPAIDDVCYHENCEQTATHRAPKPATQNKSKPQNKKNTQHWNYFCPEHIETYNKSYDYFADMSPEEIIRFVKADDIGHRPMWKLGGRGPKKFIHTSLRDTFYMFGRSQNYKAEDIRAPKKLPRQQHALQTLGLCEQADDQEIKSRFKELVKQYHPDLNGGNRKYEHRLVAVIQSYNELKKGL